MVRALVAPHAGAWIETDRKWCITPAAESRPMRARGLKLLFSFSSHRHGVAPHAGAWIETFGIEAVNTAITSRPMRARGLKQGYFLLPIRLLWSRPMRARGLKLEESR